MIEIHFSSYVEIIKLFLSQKSQFDLVENINNKNKNRTRASLFQSSEDGKQEIFYVALVITLLHTLKFCFMSNSQPLSSHKLMTRKE